MQFMSQGTGRVTVDNMSPYQLYHLFFVGPALTFLHGATALMAFYGLMLPFLLLAFPNLFSCSSKR
jgi:hypothetical protein